MPRIKRSIAKHNVGRFHEVFLGVVPAEVVQGPIVLRILSISFSAPESVFFLVPGRRGKHGCLWVGSERHRHFVAVKHVPAVLVDVIS